MKIHGNTLDTRDLIEAVATSPGVGYANLALAGSRSHAKAWTIALVSDGTPDKDGTKRNRRPGFANARDIAPEHYAASYADWGRFLAHLFTLDPTAQAGPYKGAEDFHRQTADAFR